jgi:hypothetical protein
VNTATLPVRPAQDFPTGYSGAVVIAKTEDTTRFLSAAVLARDVTTGGASASVEGERVATVAFEHLNPDQRLGIEILYSGPPPGVDIKMIGGDVEVKRGSRRRWIDALAEEWGPLVAAMVSLSLAGSLFRTIEGLKFPRANIVAALAFASLVAAILVTVRYVAPWWRVRRDQARARLCLDFLVGRDQRTDVSHSTVAADAVGPSER